MAAQAAVEAPGPEEAPGSPTIKLVPRDSWGGVDLLRGRGKRRGMQRRWWRSRSTSEPPWDHWEAAHSGAPLSVKASLLSAGGQRRDGAQVTAMVEQTTGGVQAAP